jgi:hypothetical protein
VALGGGDDAGLAQFAHDAAHHDRVGHQAFRQDGRCYGIGLVHEVNERVQGDGKTG